MIRYSWVKVGVFPDTKSPKFETFLSVADALRSEFAFRHTSDASLLPVEQPKVEGAAVRVIKSFDEGYADITVRASRAPRRPCVTCCLSPATSRKLQGTCHSPQASEKASFHNSQATSDLPLAFVPSCKPEVMRYKAQAMGLSPGAAAPL